MKQNQDYQKPAVRKRMYEQVEKLMDQAASDIYSSQEKGLYSLAVHHHLQRHAWEIMFPLGREYWPNNFCGYLCDPSLPWPQATSYSYCMDVTCPPFLSHGYLMFGYAVLGGKLVRTTFFSVETIVKYQIMPQAMVIDPLATHHGIVPEYYLGCRVDRCDIDNLLISRENPLESFVKRINEKQHKERLYNSYMEAYNLQMAYEPGWFPKQLLAFAEEYGLYVPPQERNQSID